MTAEQAAEQAAGLDHSCPFSRLRLDASGLEHSCPFSRLRLVACAATADQAAQQAASTAARLVACAATRRMPRLISRCLIARLRLPRHLTFVVLLCRAATHPDKQALHRQPPQGLSPRTASSKKFLPPWYDVKLARSACGSSLIIRQKIYFGCLAISSSEI